VQAFTYENPRSLDQALSLFGSTGEKARALVGGTDLLIQMRAATRQPSVVVDVKSIPNCRSSRLIRKVGCVLVLPCRVRAFMRIR